MSEPARIAASQVALLFVDMQEGPLATVRSMPPGELRANAIALAKVARVLSLPTVFAAAAVDGPGGVLAHDVRAELPDAPVARHATNDVWRTPEVIATLDRFARPYLAVAGVATDVGLLLAAVGGVASGRTTYAIVDVSATLDARIEQAAWLRMATAGVRQTSWSAFTGEVHGNYLEPPGPELRAIIGERLRATGGVFHPEGEP